MGAAKRRGTFEERKAQAIDNKRFKEAQDSLIKEDEQTTVSSNGAMGASMLLGMAAAMNGPLNRDKSIFR